MDSITVACPIVYGSIAFYLGKKAEEFNTHRWSLYVRGPHDEDLSVFIEKVAFTLHPSFEQQVRVITQPPFEITETGWGEFEAGIRLYFKDPDEQPIDMFHQIRLYPPMAQQQLNVKKPVVAENYDEIIFYSPKPAFYNALMMYGSTTLSSNTAPSSDAMDVQNDRKPTAHSEYYTAFDDNLDCELLLSIKEHLDKEIIEAKNRLVNVEAEYVDYLNRKQQEPPIPPPPISTPNTMPITSNPVNSFPPSFNPPLSVPYNVGGSGGPSAPITSSSHHMTMPHQIPHPPPPPVSTPSSYMHHSIPQGGVKEYPL